MPSNAWRKASNSIYLEMKSKINSLSLLCVPILCGSLSLPGPWMGRTFGREIAEKCEARVRSRQTRTRLIVIGGMSDRSGMKVCEERGVATKIDWMSWKGCIGCYETKQLKGFVEKGRWCSLQFLTTFDCSNAFSHVNKKPLSVNYFLVLIFVSAHSSFAFSQGIYNRSSFSGCTASPRPQILLCLLGARKIKKKKRVVFQFSWGFVLSAGVFEYFVNFSFRSNMLLFACLAYLLRE